MKIQFLFAWYDLWIGLYFDKKNRKLYIFPLPMIGIVILFGRKDMKSLNFLSNEPKTGSNNEQKGKYCKCKTPDLYLNLELKKELCYTCQKPLAK